MWNILSGGVELNSRNNRARPRDDIPGVLAASRMALSCLLASPPVPWVSHLRTRARFTGVSTGGHGEPTVWPDRRVGIGRFTGRAVPLLPVNDEQTVGPCRARISLRTSPVAAMPAGNPCESGTIPCRVRVGDGRALNSVCRHARARKKCRLPTVEVECRHFVCQLGLAT